MLILIVLAAGMSERFGRNKLLEKVDNKTIIRKIVEESIKSKADKVVVVTGFEAEKIASEIKDLPVIMVHNENYKEGMSSSVKVGVKKARELGATAFMILPADNFLITSKTINKVIDKYLETKGPIVVPKFKGKRGHPILFDNKLYDDIMLISEETQGLKYVVRKYYNKIVDVEVESPEIYIDIDTPEDLENLRKLGFIK